MLQKISGIEKCQEEREREGGASRLSLKNLLSHRTEQLRRGNLCFRKILVSKIVKDKRERGGITTFCRKFVVSQYRKTSSRKRGNLCFRKFLVSKKVKDNREGGHHDFPTKICCPTIPKNFVGETCVSEKFWYRKMLRIGDRGGVTTFHRNFVVSQYRKLRRGNLCFRKFLVSKNVKDKRERGHHDFPSKLCCLRVPKIFVGETCVSENFWYRKMLRIRERGSITTFHRNFVVSQYRKTSQGKLVFQKISGTEKC